ncbi:MAG: hypothetical protein MZV70_01760 [Desulfobacterales bacterium]|nr:hypothetical protein [Desulfobacterales bacterium]
MLGDVLDQPTIRRLSLKNLIIVIDQSDDDETKLLCEKYPNFKYAKIPPEEVSVSETKALSFLREEFLFILTTMYYLKIIIYFVFLDFFNNHINPIWQGAKLLLNFSGKNLNGWKANY